MIDIQSHNSDFEETGVEKYMCTYIYMCTRKHCVCVDAHVSMHMCAYIHTHYLNERASKLKTSEGGGHSSWVRAF